MNLIPINQDIQPSSALQYEAYLSEIGDNIIKFDITSSKLTTEFARYIYNQIEWGVKQFGKPIKGLCYDIEIQLRKIGRPLKKKVIYCYYTTIKFLESIRFEDRILYDRTLKALTKGIIRFTHLNEIANSGNEFQRKMDIVNRVIKERHTVADIRLLIGCKKNINETYNWIEGDYIMEYFRVRYLKNGMNIYMPYDSYEDAHGMYKVAPEEFRNKFYMRGQFLIGEMEEVPNDSYDGCFIYPPIYNIIKNSGELPLKTNEDWRIRLENMIDEAFRITQLNGVIGIIMWNIPLHKQEKVDWTQLAYKLMEQRGEWIDTMINPLKMYRKKINPNNAYRTILIFKKR